MVAHVDSWPGRLGLAELLLESSVCLSQTADAPRRGNKEHFPVNNSTLQPSPSTNNGKQQNERKEVENRTALVRGGRGESAGCRGKNGKSAGCRWENELHGLQSPVIVQGWGGTRLGQPLLSP